MLNSRASVAMAAVVCSIAALCAGARGQSAVPVVAAIGDSLTDEYSEQPYGTYAKSWTQLLVEAGRIDMGPKAAQILPAGTDWGEPRRTGYQNNWARYSHTTEWAISSGQPAGAALSVSLWSAEYVIVYIGGNDFSPWAYGVYDRLFLNQWSPLETETFVAGRVANLRSIIQSVQPSGAKIVLCSVPDFSFMPWVWQFHNSPIDRERVTMAIRNLRDRTRALANEYHLVFLDTFQLNKDLFGENLALRPSVLIGNVPIALHSWRVQPDSGFIEDATHPHTVIQGVWGAAMLTALRVGYRVPAVEFSEREIVEAAGLTYGGVDTLGQIMPPLKRYVQDFRCAADLNVDGAVSVQDIFDFLEAYFVSDTRADIDGNSVVTSQDLFTFLSLYFTGCP